MFKNIILKEEISQIKNILEANVDIWNDKKQTCPYPKMVSPLFW